MLGLPLAPIYSISVCLLQPRLALDGPLVEEKKPGEPQWPWQKD
jgi:hypothetical protein